MPRVCVFCGSRPGARAHYVPQARALGVAIVKRGLGVVYGGASVGTMGAIADAALAEGGEVVGVIPEALVAREIAHRSLTDLRVVPSMHARKALMSDLSDAFVVLPGGLGTLEELYEVATWGMLGIHRKPIGLLDAHGYWDPMFAFLEHAVAEGFVDRAHLDLFVRGSDPDALLDALFARASSLAQYASSILPDER